VCCLLRALVSDEKTFISSASESDENDPDGEDAGDDDEATGDNPTLFSEVQLSGDVDEPVNNGTSMDNDFRLNQMRRPTISGRRVSVAPPVRPPSLIDIEKVIQLNLEMSLSSFSCQRFPGISDKRDRLPLIDYDQLTMQTVGPKLSLTSDHSRRSRSVVIDSSSLSSD
jgi:hypothetical protein